MRTSGVLVPKTLAKYPEDVAWAYRHGVVTAMMSRGIYGPIRRAGGAAVIAPTMLLRLADRVRREWLRRHPVSASSVPTEEA
jgi:hypothetical protein